MQTIKMYFTGIHPAKVIVLLPLLASKKKFLATIEWKNVTQYTRNNDYTIFKKVVVVKLLN